MKKHIFLSACLLGLAWGCGSAETPADDDVVTGDAGVDPVTPAEDAGTDPTGNDDSGVVADTDSGTPALEDAGAPSEDAGVTPVTSCADTGSTYYYVASWLNVAGTADGVSKGFNLDGSDNRPSAAGGSGTSGASCNRADFTSPSGVGGIDNQAGHAVAQLSGEDGLIDFDIGESTLDAINNGELVVLLELNYVDDFVADDCIEANLLFGTFPGDAAPMLSGDRIAAGQAFAISEDSYDLDGNPLVSISSALVDGGFEAGPVDLTVTVPFSMDMDIPLTVNMGMIGFQLSSDGSALTNGVIGGSVDNTTLGSALSSFVGSDVSGLLGLLYADMNRSAAGSCQAMSASLEFETVSATIATP